MNGGFSGIAPSLKYQLGALTLSYKQDSAGAGAKRGDVPSYAVLHPEFGGVTWNLTRVRGFADPCMDALP